MTGLGAIALTASATAAAEVGTTTPAGAMTAEPYTFLLLGIALLLLGFIARRKSKRHAESALLVAQSFDRIEPRGLQGREEPGDEAHGFEHHSGSQHSKA